MNRTLLDYYEREILRFQQDGEALAQASPRASALINLYRNGDPFVKQLGQAFAYTQARMELKLDSERDRLPTALLQMLHPAVCRPVPPRTIVQFGWGSGDIEREGRSIPAGTKLKLEDANEIPFRTVGPAILPAVELKSAQLLADGARQRLRLRLESPRPDSLKLSDVRLCLPPNEDGFPLDRSDPRRYGLRVFLGGAENESSFAIYHALTLLKVTAELVLNNGRRYLIPNCIRAAGFDSSESLLPTDHRQLEPMRLLAEYVLMREKFLFVDIVGLRPELFREAEGGVSLDLMLDSSTAVLIDKVKQSMRLRLGCVPVVNLGQESLKTMPLHRRSSEFIVSIDSADPQDEKEIFSIDQVCATRWGESELEYLEMFRPLPPHLGIRHDRGGYWSSRRVPCTSVDTTAGRTSSGSYDDSQFQSSDMLLSLVEFDPRETLKSGRSLQIAASCFSRDVKRLIGRPLRFTSNMGSCDAVCDLYPAVAPTMNGDVVLRLVEHLACGVGLLQSWGDPRASVSRFLELFKDIYPTVVGTQYLLSDAFISALSVKPTAAPLAGGIARGVKLEMEIDRGGVSIHEAYLLLRVLEVALSAYCSSGGFSQLSVRYKDGRETKEIECPARIGKIALI
jgi:type VI secretion system protein ImpG